MEVGPHVYGSSSTTLNIKFDFFFFKISLTFYRYYVKGFLRASSIDCDHTSWNEDY